jgi:hypothetical protein
VCGGSPTSWREREGAPLAGFWQGLWHGIISPVTFVVSLFNHDVGVYKVHNDGGWYNFGFLIRSHDHILWWGCEFPSQRHPRPGLKVRQGTQDAAFLKVSLTCASGAFPRVRCLPDRRQPGPAGWSRPGDFRRRLVAPSPTCRSTPTPTLQCGRTFAPYRIPTGCSRVLVSTAGRHPGDAASPSRRRLRPVGAVSWSLGEAW